MANGPRGRYNQYLYDDSLPIPKTSRWRRNKQGPAVPSSESENEAEVGYDGPVIINNIAAIPVDSSGSDDEVELANVMPNNINIVLHGEENAINDGEQNQENHEMELRAHQLNEESLRGVSSSNDGSDTDDFGPNPMNESAASRMSIGSGIREEPLTGNPTNFQGSAGNSLDSSTEELMSDNMSDAEGVRTGTGEPAYIQELLNKPEWKKPLYKGCCLSTMQVILILATFSVSLSMTNEGFQSLLTLLAMILPDDSQLPKTVYLFKKLLPPFNGETVFFCPKCTKTLEENNLIELTCVCDPAPLLKKDLVKKGFFYMKLSIKDQLCRLLEEHSLGKLLKDNKECNNHVLSDITDGIRYKTFAGGKLLSKYALSLVMNTDGAPVFNSSKSSMWPVQFFINELPPRMRKKFMILGCIWVGKVKPSLNALLQSTLEDLESLSTVGFQWALDAATIITSTVDLVGCSVDSVARAPLQNFDQFNGLFGCSWCEHSGTQLPKEEGGHRIYENRPSLRMRSRESVLKHATLAESNGYSVYGVKGLSVLSILPLFDIVAYVLFDSMHCVDLGVTRQLASLWFDSNNHDCPWYMGPDVRARLDNRLFLIRPPSNLTRSPRSIDERSYWKASEWRNFLLYYSPMALFGLLPEPYFSHFMLLSEAIYLLNQSTITFTEVFEAREKLELFVKDFQRYYGLENMSFNVHQLLHACDCVLNWGPLWAYSAYGFEDLNGKLLNMFNGTQAVALQIAKRFSTILHLKCVTDYICHHINCDDNLARFVEIQKRLLGSFIPTKKAICNNEIALFGKCLKQFKFLSNPERASLKRLFGKQVRFQDKGIFASKMTYCNNLYTTKNYRSECRRKNCYVITKKFRFYQIESIANIATTNSEVHTVIFGRFIKFRSVLNLKQNCQLIKVVSISPNLSAFEPSDILSKCIMLRPEPNLSFAVMSNSFDRD